MDFYIILKLVKLSTRFCYFRNIFFYNLGIIDNILAKKAIDVGLDQFFKNLIKNLIKNFNQNPIEKVDHLKKLEKNFNFIKKLIFILF